MSFQEFEPELYKKYNMMFIDRVYEAITKAINEESEKISNEYGIKFEFKYYLNELENTGYWVGLIPLKEKGVY